MKKIARTAILIFNFLGTFKKGLSNFLTLACSAICLFVGSSAFSQTVLLSPAGDGGFETGSSFAANGWTVVSAANNFWEVGTVATQYAGSNGVYVANTAGTYAYSNTTIRTSHFYRDIAIPACATNITLSFYWKGKGESGYDRCLVYTAPTTVTPVINIPASSSTTLTGATLRWTQPAYTNAATYTLATITGLDALAGTTVRFIFTWQNDGSLGATPGTAIDNVSLVYNPASLAISAPSSSAVGASVATLGGNITSVSCSNVVERGIYYSTTNGFVDGTGTKVSETTGPYSTGGFTENVTGLSPSTVYYYKAFAANGTTTVYTSQGTFTTMAPASVFLSASTGAANGEFTTLKAAFDAINAGTHGGIISITLGNTNGQTITETAQAVLNASGSGSASYTSVSISPLYANVTVTSNLAASTIKLLDAQNVTIDGRIGLSGSTVNLTIENSSTSSSSTGAIIFLGASGNIVRYCNLKSSTTNTGAGYATVSFYDNTAGCSTNTIEYCTITKSGANWPLNAIASRCWSTRKSINNVIQNCTISDFKRYGIWLGNSGSLCYNEGWTISNNTFYESSGFAIDATTYSNHAIYIGYHGSGTLSNTYYESGKFTITNNTIGGNGSGGSWTVTGSSSSNFICGIYVAAYLTDYTEINGNTIQNFDVETQYFAGICVDNRTKVKIGSTSGNTISGIVLKHPAVAGGTAVGIYVNTNSDYTNEIKNNSISFSTSTGNNYNNLYGIYNCSSTTHPKDIVSNNIVTNIDASKASVAYGLYAQGYVAQNHVSKIKFSGINPLYGIWWGGGKATGLDYRVENNEVILGLDNSGSSAAVNSDIYGIYSNRSEINLFYNSVLLQGTATTKNSYCLRLNSNATGYIVKNNLLYNERSGGSGNHYCISTAFTTTSFWTSSNNAYVLYSGSKAAYYVGDWGGTGKATLNDWTTASAETNSISETTANKPVADLFPNVSGSGNLQPFNDGWLCAGTIVAPVTDFINVARHNPAPTTIGAYELDCVTILPIELLTFSCISVDNKKVLLKWSTASEINNDFFTIERSSDGQTFKGIMNIPGAGNSNTVLFYQTFDNDPLAGVNYYRLKQTDFDGKFTYSNIEAANLFLKEGLADVAISPNPFNSDLYIDVSRLNATNISIQIEDLMGKIVYSVQDINSDIGTIRLSLDGSINNGYYCVKIKYPEGTLVEKVLKY